MKRREFLAGAAGTLAAAGARPAAAQSGPERPVAKPLDLGPGPHLFVDSFLIEQSEGLARVVQHPTRLPEPVLSSARFGTTQPYLGVVRDPETRRLRLWYNRGPAVWHTTSADGIAWDPPRVAWDIPRGYGVTVIDDRGRDADPGRRFKLASWQATRAVEDTPRDDGGMYVAFSPDGLRWTPYGGNPVLRTWPTAWPKIEAHGVGDIVDAFYDPIRRRYGVALKVHALPEDGYAPAPRAGAVYRRLVGMSTSADFTHWEKPQRIFVPDDADEGLLEFYGMGGVHSRGPLLIGFVRVLRDDLPCDPGGPKDGIGYTVLATSRDGVRWQRDREPFLDRNLAADSWDHAMAWGSGVMAMGDETFLYYGGYARGHKVAADRERQIGLARFPRDRYVARAAGAREGLLRTRPFLLPGGPLTVNARVRSGGQLQARLLDEPGQVIAGFDWGDAAPITGDSLTLSLSWRTPLVSLAGKPVRLEFRLREGELYGFDFSGGRIGGA